MCRPCLNGSTVGTRIGKEQFGCREIVGTAYRCSAGRLCVAHTQRQRAALVVIAPSWRHAGARLAVRWRSGNNARFLGVTGRPTVASCRAHWPCRAWLARRRGRVAAWRAV